MYDFAGAVKNIFAAIDGMFDFFDHLSLSKEEKLQFHEALSKITLELNKLATEIVRIGADVAKAEMQSDSWLAKNWRPITMMVFLYIIVHTILLVPIFHLPSVAGAVKDVPVQIWEFLGIGLGGYAVARSIEKSIKSISIKGLINKISKK